MKFQEILSKLPRCFLPLASFCFALALAAAVFFSRAPVLLVADVSFNLIYGPERSRREQIENSLRLFRPVKVITVSESAGPDVIAVSVKSACKAPYAVIFPYRYEEGAVLYKEENPDTMTFVLGGREKAAPRKDGLNVIYTDTALDYYRAGIAAAILAGENPGTILFIYDGNFGGGERAAFEAGIKATGKTKSPLFISADYDFGDWQNAASIVVTGQAPYYFEENSSVPAVILSWIDPAFTPRNVKLIFDDSPWALVRKALKKLESGEGAFLLPSEAVMLSKRFDDRELAQKIASSLQTPLERGEQSSFGQ